MVGAVCDELKGRGEVESAVRNVVYQSLSDVIGQHADRFFGARRTQEMSTLIVLVAKGDVYLRIKEAAKIASCSERTLYRALESGEIPSIGPALTRASDSGTCTSTWPESAMSNPTVPSDKR